MRGGWDVLIAVLAAAVVLAALCYGFDRSWGRDGDQFEADLVSARRSILSEAELPFWMPYRVGGHDAWADPQSVRARPWENFLTVTLPLTLPGLAAGALLVFIPASAEFIVPDLLGGPDTNLLGRVIWSEFFSNRDWPATAALASALVAVLAGPILLFQRLQARA